MKYITIKVKDQTWEAIRDSMKEDNSDFVCNYVGKIVDLLLDTNIEVHKEDLSWFKYLYFMSTMGMTAVLQLKKANNPKWKTLQSILAPLHRAYIFAVISDNYPLTAEMDMKLNDVANVVCDFVTTLKINDASLKRNKLATKLNEARRLLNLGELEEV